MRDSQWLMPAAALLLAQHAAAWGISFAVHFPEEPPTISYMVAAAVLSLGAALTLFFKKLWSLWRAGEEHPLSRLQAETDWSVVATYFLGFQFVALQVAALTWLKEMIPYVIPFWADPLLASIDHAVLGTDAWKLVPAVMLRPLDVLYAFWAPVKFFALVMMLGRPASALKSRALLAYFLNIGLLGVTGQYLLSSGGPIFYDSIVGGNRFIGLLARIHEHGPIASATSRYLWNAYTTPGGEIGTGISAMPSIHVSTTAWTALVISALWPRIRLIMWGWWLVIFLGSVALGWHYLMDSVVATVGALLCWKLAPYLLRSDRRQHQETPVIA